MTDDLFSENRPAPRSVLICVPGKPVPKGRPRAAKRGNFIQMYTPETTKQYEAHVRLEAALSMRGSRPFTGPVEVRMQIFVPIPTSFNKARAEDARLGRIFPTASADIDNVCKSVLDAMNEIVFKDDSQVVDAHLTKRYADEPCVICIITEIP